MKENKFLVFLFSFIFLIGGVFANTDYSFVSVWDTTKVSDGSSNSTTIDLPLYIEDKDAPWASFDISAEVDWGDGTKSDLTINGSFWNGTAWNDW